MLNIIDYFKRMVKIVYIQNVFEDKSKINIVMINEKYLKFWGFYVINY